MKGAILYKSQKKQVNSSIYKFIFEFIFEPFKSGLFGFAAFFTVLIFATGLSYLLGFTSEYNISSDDVLISILGFVIIYFIKLIDNIKHRSTN